ncbi:MAG: glycosyltransferase [Muribaculaceae bacterium]|nr:glycosyltransferase [Muribaculaceae bacterium]
MKQNSPLISVIVPVYNAGKYLTDTLASISTQTYRHIEPVIVNDGSTADDSTVCRAFAASHHATKLIEQNNRGQSAARNVALEAATGEYIVFLDADDVMAPQFCETMLHIIQATESDMVDAQHIDFHQSYPEWKPEPRQHLSMTGIDSLADMLYQRHLTSAPWGKIFRHTAIGDHRFRHGIIYEDLEWLSRVLPDMRRVTWSDSSIYGYRQHADSALGHFSSARLDVLKVTAEIRTRVAAQYPELIPAADDRMLSASFNMLALLELNGRGNTPEADQCWQTICRLRGQSLRNPQVRLKNKVGAIASLGGRKMFNLLAHVIR